MKYKDVYNGEHFVIGGKTLYRKTRDGHVVVQGATESIYDDTQVTVVDPVKWFIANTVPKR
jgi:hypothetical protein